MWQNGGAGGLPQAGLVHLRCLFNPSTSEGVCVCLCVSMCALTRGSSAEGARGVDRIVDFAVSAEGSGVLGESDFESSMQLPPKPADEAMVCRR